MKTILISIFMLLAITLKGQTNESPLNRYDWSKKMTQPENGCVVLKSGTEEISKPGSGRTDHSDAG